MEPNDITPEKIRATVKELIAEITEREPEEVSDTALFTEELGIDSLAGMEIMVSVDKRFKVDIPEEEFAKIKNVNDAVEMVQRYLGRAVDSTSA
ncbi:MAG: acyl carrier protein [Bryobacteraceae bacterium]